MEAVILAGGFGKRLRSRVPNSPKAMAQIAGVPFLEILLNKLQKKGFSRLIISTFYKGEIIKEYFGDSFLGMRISYSNDQKELGTGGALRAAEEICNENHYYVFNGDTFFDIDIQLMESFWSRNKKPILVATEVKNCERFGTIKIDRNYLAGFDEKKNKSSGLINAGCYLFPKNFLQDWELGQTFSLEKDLLQKIFHLKKIMCLKMDGLFIDIGIPEDYNRAQILLKDEI